MTLLLDIAPYIPPVAPTATGDEIYRRFQEEPDTLAIAVVDAQERPVGLIERNAFLVRMAAEYGRALWSGRPVSVWMKTDPVTADGDVTVEEFCGKVLEERPSELMHGFVVTCGGRYAGVGAMLALLQASAAANESHAREMTRLADEAREALEAKARFLAVMSHEIRTPLNGVLAVAEIIRRKSIQADLAPFVDTILESGQTLLRLLNDALDLSRAEASGLELDEEPMQPAALLDEAASPWSALAELKGLTLTTAFEGDTEAWALADRVRLRQILDNLVGNALKFTQTGGVTIRLSTRVEGACLHVSGVVADTGPGVAVEKLDAIFAPFQQTAEGVRKGGAGLGLAVCRQIADRMGGTIAAMPNPGGGALFSFDIPLYRVPAPAAEEEASQAMGHADQPLHVLIVDDNAANRLVARTLCEMFGCTSECASDGETGVTTAAGGRFDLILMDIKMPGIDGVEATRRIRSGAGAASKVPIVALTANADPGDAAFYRACGMNGVVEKPIKPERLLAAMQAVVGLDREVVAA
jgi:signal transduction histidine kinase/ActR/RegA family two-component response regulator